MGLTVVSARSVFAGQVLDQVQPCVQQQALEARGSAICKRVARVNKVRQ